MDFLDFSKDIMLLLLFLVHVSTATIDPDLVEELNTKDTSKVLVYFRNGNSEVIKNIRHQSFPSHSSKVKALTNGLQGLASSMQEPLQGFLRSQNVQSISYWASNQMIIHDADLPLLQRVDLFPQVKRIRKLPEIQLDPLESVNSYSSRTGDAVPWGIAKIQAEQVWSRYEIMGQNVVVANIDTGVRLSHEALKDSWRSDHGWFDPYFNSTSPNDENGHGTHTMGTIVGTGGIGVAPKATWIACRGCAKKQCDAAELLACGQWVLSPTNPDGTDPQPSMIPDIVSNSWGNPGGNDDWFNTTIEAWNEAGILHVFAIGNSGPLCRSASSPGDQPGVFSVGSTDEQDRLSIFSSKGPVGFFENQRIKPDISAPGSDIYSAWNTGDSDFKSLSGTSMSTPAVAGTMALILSARRYASGSDSEFPRIEMDEMQNILTKTTDTKDLSVTFPNSRCSSGQTIKWPNNEFGYGRLNALKAVHSALKIA